MKMTWVVIADIDGEQRFFFAGVETEAEAMAMATRAGLREDQVRLKHMPNKWRVVEGDWRSAD